MRVQPGERLLIMGAGKMSSAVLGGQLNVVLRRYDHTKTAIIGQGVLQWTTETAWTEKTALYSVPSDTYYLGLRVQTLFGTTAGNAYVDELHVFRIAQRQTSGDDFDNGNKAANFTLDWNSGQNQRVRLTASITISFSNLLKGAVYVLRLVQDGTGGRTPTLSGVTWSGGAAPAWVTTANHQALITLYSPDGAALFASPFGLDFNSSV